MKENNKIKIDKYLPFYYAGASGDFNPIHTDTEYAKNAGLPGIILQGLCTMALVYKFGCEDVSPEKIKSFKVRFKGIVKPEDEITIEKEINILDAKKQISLLAKNQDENVVISNAELVIQD